MELGSSFSGVNREHKIESTKMKMEVSSNSRVENDTRNH